MNIAGQWMQLKCRASGCITEKMTAYSMSCQMAPGTAVCHTYILPKYFYSRTCRHHVGYKGIDNKKTEQAFLNATRLRACTGDTDGELTVTVTYHTI